MRSARSLAARRTIATAPASAVTQARLPSATPATSRTAPPELSAAPATLAAAKIAAHDAIVVGIRRRPGERREESAARIRDLGGNLQPAAHPESAVERADAERDQHAAPASPSTSRSGSIVSSGAAPAAPAAA